MPSVCVQMDHFIGDFDPGRRRDAVTQLRSLLSVIAEVGGHGAITPAAWGMFSRRLPPFYPPRSEAEDREVLIEGLHNLGEHAAHEGALLLFEPLSRCEDHMVNTLAQASVALYTFMIASNEFLFALLFLLEAPARWTLSLGVQQRDSVEVPRTWLMAGSAITTVPIVVLFFFFERFLTSGLTAGAVKG